MIAFLLIPQPAASARDWMVWSAAVCTALGVIVVTIRAVFKATARWVERKLVKALATEFTAVNTKIDGLTEAWNAHLGEAEETGKVVAALVGAYEADREAQRDELAHPGLPPGPPRPKYRM